MFLVDGGADVAAKLDLNNLTVANGRTGGVAGGAGVANFGGVVEVNNSTLSGNESTQGGGIFNQGAATVRSSTISGNNVPFPDDGGGIYGSTTLEATIIANNGGGDCVNGTPNFDSGYNPSSDSSCALYAASSLPGTDPMLGPLADNGGPSRTHALLPDSPAIDAIPSGTNCC